MALTAAPNLSPVRAVIVDDPLNILFISLSVVVSRCTTKLMRQHHSMQNTPDSRTTMNGLADSGNTIVQHGFRITTRKCPILKAEPIEQMTAKLGISPPEMIFGDNEVTIDHLESQWGIKFTAFDALDRVDKSGGSMLQVAHSREWQSTRYGD